MYHFPCKVNRKRKEDTFLTLKKKKKKKSFLIEIMLNDANDSCKLVIENGG